MNAASFDLTRRQMIGTMTGTIAAISCGFSEGLAARQPFVVCDPDGSRTPLTADSAFDGGVQDAVSFKLPDFNYDKNNLLGLLSPFTIRTHHAVVHQRVVDRLNRSHAALGRTVARSIRPETASEWGVEYSRQLRDHLSHSVYWKNFSFHSKWDATPHLPAIQQAVFRSFGSFEGLGASLLRLCTSRQTGDWLWIFYLPENGRLVMTRGNRHGNGWPAGAKLIVAIDLADHAYSSTPGLIKAEYVAKLLPRLNWNAAGSLISSGRLI